jgi:hypothetical protein
MKTLSVREIYKGRRSFRDASLYIDSRSRSALRCPSKSKISPLSRPAQRIGFIQLRLQAQICHRRRSTATELSACSWEPHGDKLLVSAWYAENWFYSTSTSNMSPSTVHSHRVACSSISVPRSPPSFFLNSLLPQCARFPRHLENV